MPRRLRAGGGYRQLRSFQVAGVIYDATVSFCARFIDRRSRTVDQMVQAARSGRQNIAEGSRASASSSQTEIRLVGIARASLDELLLDYEDFLRQRGLRQWSRNDREALELRAVGTADRSDPTDRPDQRYNHWLNHPDPEVVANCLICLIHQANYLLDRQIAALERAFVSDGGYTERLAAARLAVRRGIGKAPDSGSARAPTCPKCGKPLVLRTVRRGARAGSQFWGCSGYPECRGTRDL